MNGWYCIYDCHSNTWFTEAGWWLVDDQYMLKSIPTEINLIQTIDSQTGETKTEILKENWEDARFYVENTKNPYSIKKFSTLKQAEDFVLSGGVIKDEPNSYFSIRKIYF